MNIFLEVFCGAFWGILLGFLWFHILYLQTQKAFKFGRTFFTNPLRLIIAALAMFVPIIFGVVVLLSSFGGFAIGFGIWWIWFSKFKRGGSND